MRTTPYSELAAAAEREARPAPVHKEPAWTPRCLKAKFEVRNRVDGNLSSLGVAHCASLAEAREIARHRALALRLPAFEVAPHEDVHEVAKSDGIYLAFIVFDEYAGGEIVRDSSFGETIWKNA